jgi:hypothetical protein
LSVEERMVNVSASPDGYRLAPMIEAALHQAPPEESPVAKLVDAWVSLAREGDLAAGQVLAAAGDLVSVIGWELVQLQEAQPNQEAVFEGAAAGAERLLKFLSTQAGGGVEGLLWLGMALAQIGRGKG